MRPRPRDAQGHYLESGDDRAGWVRSRPRRSTSHALEILADLARQAHHPPRPWVDD